MTVADDPVAGARWQVLSEDTFDRDTPRAVEARGTGLAAGLAELWRRFLTDTVTERGQRGFYRFNLWWEQGGCSVSVDGPWSGAVRLRQWVLAAGTVDRLLLDRIAVLHAGSVVAGGSSRAILEAAERAEDESGFRRFLDDAD